MAGKATRPGRGRPAKPTAQKKLQGAHPARINKHEPKFTKITNAEPPEWMDEDARLMWQTVIPELCAGGVLAVTDLHNVEAFCMAYSRWRVAEQEIAAYGITVEGARGVQKNPAVTVAGEAMRQIVTFGSLLGLDPSSRSRLIGGNNESAGNEFNDF